MYSFNPQKLEKSSLGSGTYGTVYPYNDNNDAMRYVIKQIWARNEKELNRFEREIDTTLSIHHPSILPLVDYLIKEDEKEGWWIMLKMERMKEGLDNFIKKAAQKKDYLPKKEVIKYFYFLVRALEYLENKGIVHQSIKPSNIFLDDRGYIKLADFALSTIVKEENMECVIQYKIASRIYTAPEMLSSDHIVKGKDLFRVDVWGLGIVMLELCLLKLKILISEQNKRIIDDEKIIQKSIEEVKERYGEKLANLLVQMLKIDPSKRKQIKEIRKALEEAYPEFIVS